MKAPPFTDLIKYRRPDLIKLALGSRRPTYIHPRTNRTIVIAQYLQRREIVIGMTFIAASYYCCQPPRTPLSILYPSGRQSWPLHLLSFIVDLAPPAQFIRFISLLCRYRQGLYVWKHPHKATINEQRGTR